MITAIVYGLTGLLLGGLGNVFNEIVKVQLGTINNDTIKNTFSFMYSSTKSDSIFFSDFMNGNNIVMIVAVMIVIINLYKLAISTIASPITGKEQENPLKAFFRVGISIIGLSVASYVQSYSFDTFGQFLNFLDIGNLSFNEIAYTTLKDLFPHPLIGLFFATALFSATISAVITYVERFVVFIMYVMLYPIGIAFYSSGKTENITGSWLQTVVYQAGSILATKMMFIIALQQMKTTHFTYLEMAVTICLMTIASRTEQILSFLNIHTFPSGSTARQVGMAVGQTLHNITAPAVLGRQIAGLGTAINNVGTHLASEKDISSFQNGRVTGFLANSAIGRKVLASGVGQAIANTGFGQKRGWNQIANGTNISSRNGKDDILKSVLPSKDEKGRLTFDPNSVSNSKAGNSFENGVQNGNYASNGGKNYLKGWENGKEALNQSASNIGKVQDGVDASAFDKYCASRNLTREQGLALLNSGQLTEAKMGNGETLRNSFKASDLYNLSGAKNSAILGDKSHAIEGATGHGSNWQEVNGRIVPTALSAPINDGKEDKMFTMASGQLDKINGNDIKNDKRYDLGNGWSGYTSQIPQGEAERVNAQIELAKGAIYKSPLENRNAATVGDSGKTCSAETAFIGTDMANVLGKDARPIEGASGKYIGNEVDDDYVTRATGVSFPVYDGNRDMLATVSKERLDEIEGVATKDYKINSNGDYVYITPLNPDRQEVINCQRELFGLQTHIDAEECKSTYGVSLSEISACGGYGVNACGMPAEHLLKALSGVPELKGIEAIPGTNAIAHDYSVITEYGKEFAEPNKLSFIGRTSSGDMLCVISASKTGEIAGMPVDENKFSLVNYNGKDYFMYTMPLPTTEEANAYMEHKNAEVPTMPVDVGEPPKPPHIEKPHLMKGNSEEIKIANQAEIDRYNSEIQNFGALQKQYEILKANYDIAKAEADAQRMAYDDYMAHEFSSNNTMYFGKDEDGNTVKHRIFSNDLMALVNNMGIDYTKGNDPLSFKMDSEFKPRR